MPRWRPARRSAAANWVFVTFAAAAGVGARARMARACGIDAMTFGQAFVILGVLALGIMVPNAPGFFGAFQISIYAGLAMFYPAEVVIGPGSAFVSLLYVCQLSVMLVGAIVGAISERMAEGVEGSRGQRVEGVG